MPDAKNMRKLLDLVENGSEASKTLLSLRDLLKILRAGRRRTGLFNVYDMAGNRESQADIFVNGELVTLVIVRSNKEVSFFAGHKCLATFFDEPYPVDRVLR